jgi:soluble lytic murein transglycosylase-like protein
MQNRIQSLSWRCFFCLTILASTPVEADVYGMYGENGAIYLTDNNEGNNFQLIATEPALESDVVISQQMAWKSKNYSNLDYRLFKDEIMKAAQLYQVEPNLLHAIILVESNYNPKAVSAKGALGLMQLMPSTAKRFGVTDYFDPKQNIQGGAKYLAYLLKLFDNNKSLAVAAYNAGEKSVIKYGLQIPPYKETIGYVAKVNAVY